MKSTFYTKFIALLINFISSIAIGLLTLRLILKLFGASTSAPFVQWIYETTYSLISPFQGMFPSPELEGGFIVEFSVLFAILVYSFVAYLLIQVLDSITYYIGKRK